LAVSLLKKLFCSPTTKHFFASKQPKILAHLIFSISLIKKKRKPKSKNKFGRQHSIKYFCGKLVSEVIHIIDGTLKRQRLLKIIAASLLIGLSLVGMLYALDSFPFQGIIGISMLVGIFIFLATELLQKAQENYLQEVKFWTTLLQQTPDLIVWIYYYKLENMPFGISMNQQTKLFFKLQNKEEVIIDMTEKDIIRVMDLLRNHLPHTTFGYSKEKKQLYDISPDLLRKQID